MLRLNFNIIIRFVILLGQMTSLIIYIYIKESLLTMHNLNFLRESKDYMHDSIIIDLFKMICITRPNPVFIHAFSLP